MKTTGSRITRRLPYWRIMRIRHVAYVNTLLLLVLLIAQFKPTVPTHKCNVAPDGWDLVIARPRADQCADVIRSRTLEGTNILRIFDHAQLKVMTAETIPCHICSPFEQMDPLVDVTWEKDQVRVFNFYGDQQTVSETWNFAQHDETWVLASWSRSLMVTSSGPYLSESTNLESRQIQSEVRLVTNESICTSAAETVRGCRDGRPAPPIRRTCSEESLSTEISRVSKHRARAFGCDIQSLIEESAEEAVPPRERTYEVVPLDDPDPAEIPALPISELRAI